MFSAVLTSCTASGSLPSFSRKSNTNLISIEDLVELVGIEWLRSLKTGKFIDLSKFVQCPECLENLHSLIHCTFIVR